MADPLEKILSVAESATNTGGHVLQRYWHDGVQLRDKSDVGGKTYDLVSDADLESQTVIANLIHESFPDHELMGEEDLVGDVEAEHLWIIDPLDGTNNFAHRVPHFAVSIAYFHRGQPTVGVVSNPITGERFSAVLGKGAKLNEKTIKVAENASLSQSLIGCGFYYDRGEMMRKTLGAVEEFFGHEIHGIRRMGTASLDLCAVASGQFGAFFEYKLSPWDFAAGQLIVTEAGGKVTTADGNPLPIAPTSVLAASNAVYQDALEITRKHHP